MLFEINEKSKEISRCFDIKARKSTIQIMYIKIPAWKF